MHLLGTQTHTRDSSKQNVLQLTGADEGEQLAGANEQASLHTGPGAEPIQPSREEGKGPVCEGPQGPACNVHSSRGE